MGKDYGTWIAMGYAIVNTFYPRKTVHFLRSHFEAIFYNDVDTSNWSQLATDGARQNFFTHAICIAFMRGII